MVREIYEELGCAGNDDLASGVGRRAGCGVRRIDSAKRRPTAVSVELLSCYHLVRIRALLRDVRSLTNRCCRRRRSFVMALDCDSRRCSAAPRTAHDAPPRSSVSPHPGRRTSTMKKGPTPQSRALQPPTSASSEPAWRPLPSPEPHTSLLHEPVVFSEQQVLIHLLNRIERYTDHDQQ